MTMRIAAGLARFILALTPVLLLAPDWAHAQQYVASTSKGTYRIVASPEGGKLVQGPIHTWILQIFADNGAPVPNAKISVDGGMMAHGHGLPTAPEVVAEREPGTYVVDGVKFSMGGEWQLRFTIEAETGNDVGEISFMIR